ncbi:fibronectin type III domain-containing protein [Clostridium formicaceticum]|uniref:Chitinase A1 n=1 Tax=Clostridium formicaceticum TaxID=1497 RepID=A0AAC9WF71_9CLOT|nr:fibronectin type III domain-containing protein [Clostridium formicaceticum]AOY76052.1 hypothetical protein BJL90_09160 [Clostridium formicaceticum]ARE86413.1 Chitinase A1 precursor [Clostridium formicaceticum]
MKRRFSGLLILCLIVLTLYGALPSWAQDMKQEVVLNDLQMEEKIPEEIKEQMGSLQMPFIKNEGQVKDEKVQFYAETFAGLVMVKEEGIVYLLPSEEDKKPQLLVEKFVDGESKIIEGQDEAVTRVNYFKGQDPDQWQQNLSTYNRVSLGEVYDNIEVNLKAYGDNVEKIFIVAPGADPTQIAIQLDGAKKIAVDEDGQLVIQTPGGALAMTAPIAYQEKEGQQIDISVSYWVEDNQYGFRLGKYDVTKELIIDPMLASSLLGGKDKDYLTSMAVDAMGNVYITGYTYSMDMLQNASRPYTGGNYFEWDPWTYMPPDPSDVVNPQDIFVAKLDGNLQSLLAATFIGGSESDVAETMMLGPDGAVYIAGRTYSSGIRTYRDYLDYEDFEYDPWEWYDDEIVFELKPPTAFPTTSGTYQERFPGTSETTTYIDSRQNSFFITRLNSNLNHIEASTFIGRGTSGTQGIYGIAFDGGGNIFVTGTTNSDAYPTTSGAYDTTFNDDGANAFVSKLNKDLTTLQASTFLGGGGGLYNGTALRLDGTEAKDIVVDTAGSVYITGSTTDKNFPIIGGYQSQFNNGRSDTSKDAFVAKLSNNLQNLQASTYLGGQSYDVGVALAVDAGGRIFVTGQTMSQDFPVSQDAYQDTIIGQYHDIFVTKLDQNLNQMLASTLLGGSMREDVYAIALDTDNVYVVGSTSSSNYPTTDGSQDGMGENILISKLDKELRNLRASTLIGGAGLYDSGNDTGKGIVVQNGKVYIAGQTSSRNYPVTEGAYIRLPQTSRMGDTDVFVTILKDTLTHARVTEVTTNLFNQTFGIGEEIPIKIKFNANVYVQGEGKPELKLNAGDEAVATYISGSGSNTLEFLYTVQAGDQAEVLNYVATDSLQLEDCFLEDAGGDLIEAVLPDPNSREALASRSIKINTVAPSIVKVTSPKADGTYGADNEIPIEIIFSEAVKVTGVPELILNTEPERVATYTSGSGTSTLTFTYLVQEEDSVENLNYKATDSLQLEEGSITDLMNNAANLTLPDPLSEESLGGNKSIMIDNYAPRATVVTSSLEDGSYGVGGVIPIQITFSEAVNVAGTPRLALNTVPQRYANYSSGSGTTVLTFEYTIQSGDNTIIAENNPQKIALNYKTVEDLILNYGTEIGTITGVDKDNHVILTLPKPDSAAALAGSKSIIVDNKAPQYKSLTTDEKTYTTYGAGTTLHINITFDEAVYVTGTPFLELNTTPDRSAVYASGSGTDTLKFIYTIQEGDAAAGELDYLTTDSLKLGVEGSIKDAVGHDADLRLPWSSSLISGGDLKRRYIKIDAIVPTWGEDSWLEATNIGETSLTLNWSKTASDNIKVEAYNLYQDTNLIATIKGTAFTSPATTYNVMDLTPAKEYTFHVEAVDAAGNESSNGPSTVAVTDGGTSGEDKEAPIWVDNSGLTVSEVGVRSLTLHWDKEDVTDNVMVTGFNIYQDDQQIPVATVDSNTTSYKVMGLKSYTEYTFRVEAIDAAGNESTNGPRITRKTEIPDLTVRGGKVKTEQEYLLADLLKLDIDENFPSQSVSAPILWQKYSTVNDFGTSRRYAAEGVRISYLLEAAGVEPGYGKVTFYSTDASPLSLTEEQINAEKYYFPASGEAILVEPMLAYLSTDTSGAVEPNFANMMPHTLRLFFGQNNAGEVLNSYYKKNIYLIVVGDAEGTTEDDEAPTWPTGSKLTASNITDTSVDLSWTLAEDNVEVTDYKIFKGAELMTTVTGSVYAYNVTGLTAGTDYTFKVEAGDAAGNWSSDGPSISVKTAAAPPTADKEVPTWPSGNLTASNVTQTGLTLTWSGAQDNVGVTNYKIFKGAELMATVTGSVYVYDLTGLTAGTDYTFKVEAGDAAGNWSSDGPSVTVTTVPTTSNVTLVLSTDSAVVGENVTASGTADPDIWITIKIIDAAENILYFDAVKSDANGNYSNTFKVPITIPGRLTVVAGYGSNVANASLMIRETTPSDHEAPTWPSGNLTVSNVTQTGLTLTWNGAQDNVDITNYRIFKDAELIATVTGSVYAYNVTGLTAGTDYTFKVEAGDAAGNWSSDGPSISVKTAAAPPTADKEAPTWPLGNLTASNVTQTGLTLTWNAANDNIDVIAYKIYQNGSFIATVDGITTTYTVSGLSSGTNYTFKVEAGDAAGNWSTDGPSVTVKTTTASSGGSGGGGGGSSTPKEPISTSTSTNTEVSVNPAKGATINLTENIHIVIPANALKETNPVSVSIKKVEIPPKASSDATLISDVYEFTVGGKKSYIFASNVKITLTFDPSAIGTDEEPAMFYYDEAQQKWINIGGEVSESTITAEVDHFTKFAVFAVEKEGSLAVVAPQLETLKDITGHWGEDNIKKLVDLQVINGYPDGSFKPDGTITRAEFATMLVKAFEFDSNDEKVFKDTANHWAKDYVSKAATFGIVSGYDADSFGPDDLITREQMTVMIVKAAKLAVVKEESTFADERNISQWAKEAVTTAVKHDIMKGYPDHTVKPQGSATRAEAVTVIIKALKL